MNFSKPVAQVEVLFTMRMRATLLVMTLGIAIVAVACGRASEQQINQALGITPPATLSAGQIATSTAAAVAVGATSAARALAAASAAASGSPAAVALGDVTDGERQFSIQCAQCHKPDGSGRGPSLTGAKGAAVALGDDQITSLIRNGTNHSQKPAPGPYKTFEISDKQIRDIIAYLRSIAGP